MSNIFSWIGHKEQRRIIVQSRKHMEKVVAVVRLLQANLEAACAGRADEMARIHDELSTFEHEADTIRRDLLLSLSQGMFLPPDRQDLVQLINRMDDVADYAHGASRVLMTVSSRLPEEVKDDLNRFAELLVEAVDKLADALNGLASADVEGALAACTLVETAEEEADHMKAEIFSKLFNLELDPPVLLMTHDLVEAMENTADRAEDTADVVRIVTVGVGR